jgi:hypothetical protein
MKNEWITDRLPSADDADSHGCVIVPSDSKPDGFAWRHWKLLEPGDPWAHGIKMPPYVKPKTEEELARESVPDGYAFDERTGERDIPVGSMVWSECGQKWIETKWLATYGGNDYALKVKTEEERARETVPDGFVFDERTGERKMPAGSMWWSECGQKWLKAENLHTAYGISHYALKVTPPVKTEEELVRESVPDGFVFDERTGKRDVPVGSMVWSYSHRSSDSHRKWCEIGFPFSTDGSSHFALKPKTQEERARACVPDGFVFDERTGERKIPACSMVWSHLQQKWNEAKNPHTTYGSNPNQYALKVTDPFKTEEERARECVPDGFVFYERTGERKMPAGSMWWSGLTHKWRENKSLHTIYGISHYALKVKTEEEMARESVPDGYVFDERTGMSKIPSGSMWWRIDDEKWVETEYPLITFGSIHYALKVKTEEEIARESVPDGYAFDERTGERKMPAGSMWWSHFKHQWCETTISHATYGSSHYALKQVTYWSKASHYPPVCYVRRKDQDCCFLITHAPYAGNIKEYRWSPEPFDNFEDGEPMTINLS